MLDAIIKSAAIAATLRAHRSYSEIQDSLYVSFNMISKVKPLGVEFSHPTP
jgi:hypothetical protein